MMDRLDPTAVIRGHWRGLRNRTGATSTPDVWVRVSVLAVPTVIAGMAFFSDIRLQEPGVMVSGLSLLSAGLLAAFAQIASIRARYTTPDDLSFDEEKSTRDMLDESVAHILTAALLSAATVILIIVGMNVADSGAPIQGAGATPPVELGRWFSTVVTWTGTYLALLFVMTVRKLYGAYIVANDVSPQLSGHHR